MGRKPHTLLWKKGSLEIQFSPLLEVEKVCWWIPRAYAFINKTKVSKHKKTALTEKEKKEKVTLGNNHFK